MAGKYDLDIDQGSAFHRLFTLTDDDGAPIDVTDYTATAELRRVEDATGDATLSVTVGSGITLDGPAGGINIDLTPAQTGGLDETPYVWELVLAPGGSADAAFSLIKGQVNVSGRVVSPVSP